MNTWSTKGSKSAQLRHGENPNEVVLVCTSSNMAASGETTYTSGKFYLYASKAGVSNPGLQRYRKVTYLLEQPPRRNK